MMFINLFLLIFSFLRISEGGKPSISSALVYLSKYGYLKPNSMSNSSQLNAKTFKESLAQFQSFAGLPITGELDEVTVEQMGKPRCGMKDKIFPKYGESSRYIVQGSKWHTRNLKYRITKYSNQLDRRTVDRTIQQAFNLWSRYVDLTFEPTNGRPHIEIRFVQRYHGDDNAFDGPGGTLAHAYYPQYGGSTHFDDEEVWTVNDFRRSQGTDLFQVAVHEFGHALGLDHSQTTQAIMAPYYKGYIPNLDLFRDDILGIQRIYGPKNGPIYPSHPKRPGVPQNPWYPWSLFPRRYLYPSFATSRRRNQEY